MEDCIYVPGTRRVRATGYDRIRAAPQFFLDLNAPIARLRAACRDADSINKMAALMQRTYGNEKADYDCCVYAVEAEGHGHTKVGISHVPLTRFITLQQAHFADLKIAGIVWAKDYRAAEKIEKLVLRAAEEMNIRARGEWLATDGDEVFELIIKAARYAGKEISDSAKAMENLSARVRALFDIKRATREILVT